MCGAGWRRANRSDRRLRQLREMESHKWRLRAGDLLTRAQRENACTFKGRMRHGNRGVWTRLHLNISAEIDPGDACESLSAEKAQRVFRLAITPFSPLTQLDAVLAIGCWGPSRRVGRPLGHSSSLASGSRRSPQMPRAGLGRRRTRPSRQVILDASVDRHLDEPGC